VPGGDLKIFDDRFDTGGAELVKIDIEMAPYLSSLPGTAKEQALVYFPIWRLDYAFEQRAYVAVISASSGEVFSGDFPKRSSGAYMAVAGSGFLAFLAEGLLAIASPVLAGARDGSDRRRCVRRVQLRCAEDVDMAISVG